MVFCYIILLYIILNLKICKIGETHWEQALVYQQSEPASCVTIEADQVPKVEEVRVNMAEMKVESRPVELLTSVGSRGNLPA
jgi:hypothetical protein